MNNEPRKTEVVIGNIKQHIKSKGFIYALSMIIFDDFHMFAEELHKVNTRERLSSKEVSLLLGFLIQDEIDFSIPESPEYLIELKKNTYKLMRELHESFLGAFFEKLKSTFESGQNESDLRIAQKDFFGHANMMVEPMFYSGTGVYDFQLLDYVEKKYKKDREWLTENKAFDIGKSEQIIHKINALINEKSQKVKYYGLRERLPQIQKDIAKRSHKKVDSKKIEEFLSVMEFHQYVELFFEDVQIENCLSDEDLRIESWKSFYRGLIDLFVIRESDFTENFCISPFLKNFSILPLKGENMQFKSIGNYNKINSNPIINLGDGRYFVPSPSFIAEAINESPFYWMMKDSTYKDQAGMNRGNFGEEITYEFLKKVFGDERTFKSVKILSLETPNSTKRTKDDTDIDVLCILGSKALCVQVKSKKLTELAKTGDDNALQNDFKGAVQDAYEQGLLTRNRILERNSKFIDENKQEIKLSEEIDEVYIMGVTTENYPSLTHQAHIMLDKRENDPYPLVLTIFDLELVTHYLNDAYDLLYYIRQRIELMDYFKASEEMVFLGYHLTQKLWRFPDNNFVILESDVGQLIDRNYYPFKMGLKISDEGDKIKHRWKNEKFERLCNELKLIKQAKITDIIFNLFDWCGEAREDLVRYIDLTKKRTLNEGKISNFSMPPGDGSFGVTYFSLDSNDIYELKRRLLELCELRKYKSRGDIWVGFGSLKDSPNMIDAIAYNDHPWIFDTLLEEKAKILDKSKTTFIGSKKKPERNEKCPCKSGLKYKNCCGKV